VEDVEPDLTYVIVPPGPADAEALARLHVESWRETYRGLLPDAFLDGMSVEAHGRRWASALASPAPGETTLALAGPARLVGYASGGPSRRGGWEIATLYLLRLAQGQGQGRRLVSALARVFADQGGGGLTISALRDNVAARTFYARLGGVAQPPRLTPGPGGIVCEVNYFWPDVSSLLDVV
jgi:GNAT superfamily N-acetyltransferase